MKIVETNIMYEGLTFHDHQSRVLEIPSWEEYCDLYKNYDGNTVYEADIRTKRKYINVYNNLEGCILPKNATIIKLKIDDYHLTCDMNLWDGKPSLKFAYIVEK